MFVQITNGRSSKKVRVAASQSPKKSFESPPRQNDETEDELKGNQEIVESVVEITPDTESVVPNESNLYNRKESKSGPSKRDKMLDKIGEKASKFIPTREGLGKFFHGDKKPIPPEPPAVYTIDREMASTNLAFRAENRPTSPAQVYNSPTRVPPDEVETFRRSELTDRLNRSRQRAKSPTSHVNSTNGKSVAVQASNYPPYRLLFVPPEEWKDPDVPIMTFIHVVMCQCTIALFLLLWIIFGALVFYLTEGPYETEKSLEFKNKENDFTYVLATDLRLIAPENNTEWFGTIAKYAQIHAEAVKEATYNGYGRQNPFWTFPGSLMFCVSLLTTLGLATPLPATTGGQVGAFIFTLLGFPLHLFFLLNLGRTIAVKTQISAKHTENKFLEVQERVINVRRFGEDLPRGTLPEIWPEKMFLVDFKPPLWLKYFPIASTLIYYIFGLLIFGVARGMAFPRIILFFVDFSSQLVSTNGMARMGYAWYLEGAAILTAVNAVLYSDSPFEGLTPLGIKMGFMINSLD